jgi:hypothetical protein
MATPSFLLMLIQDDVNAPAPLGGKITRVVDAIRNGTPEPLKDTALNALYDALNVILANPMMHANHQKAIGRALMSAMGGPQFAGDPDIQALRQQLKSDVEAAL